jgi:hypothetical protein
MASPEMRGRTGKRSGGRRGDDPPAWISGQGGLLDEAVLPELTQVVANLARIAVRVLGQRRHSGRPQMGQQPVKLLPQRLGQSLEHAGISQQRPGFVHSRSC